MIFYSKNRKKRKHKVKFYKNKRILMYSMLGLFLFLGMGYSVLNTELNIFGDVTVKEYVEPTLYNVLKKEAETNGLAKEYTGSHGDSMDSSKSTEKIYHWYATNNTEGTQILDKNNVIFAGQCWQMIRTTDTGGVKMIYNGEAENNQCLNTRGNHIGYAERTSQSLNSNYWYGTDYTYDSTNQVFSISGTTEQTTWNATTGPTLIGKYTCRQTTEAGTCSTLYLVESYKDTSKANVIPLNSNSHYSQFGTLKFNANYSSPADVGYMYNTIYNSNERDLKTTESMLEVESLNIAYWYSDTVTWGTPTTNRYNLDNPYQVASTDDYPSLVGKYTFLNSSNTYTNSIVYYIVAVNGSKMYCIKLINYGNHTLSDYNHTYTYGDTYQDNGNGTYTIKNQDESTPPTINRSDWYTEYSNVGAGKYVCRNAINDTCSDLWYTYSTSNGFINYYGVLKKYKYSKSFEYKLDPDDNTYKYFLDDTMSITFFEWNNTNKANLNNAHYTCWNEEGKCASVSYIYYISEQITNNPYFINITDGKSVEDAMNEMLYNNDVNQVNSIIKNGIDAWYKKYIFPYDSYVEDTIFCNDRSVINANTNGWNPNGGSLSTDMNFKEYTLTSDLSCINETDKFSISNSLAHLTYKVGLMTLPEMKILNYPETRKTGQIYWLGSPYSFKEGNGITSHAVNAQGFVNFNFIVTSKYGVRPSVSLISGTEYLEGNGTMANPYIVKMD